MSPAFDPTSEPDFDAANAWVFLSEPEHFVVGDLTQIVAYQEYDRFRSLEAAPELRRYVSRVFVGIGDIRPLEVRRPLVGIPCYAIELPNGETGWFVRETPTAAVFLKMKVAEGGFLDCIEVECVASTPTESLRKTRSFVQRFLSLIGKGGAAHFTIAGIEVRISTDELPITGEIPFVTTRMRVEAGGYVDATPRFAKVDALIREGWTTKSPFYRLLIAFKIREGLRKVLRPLMQQEIRRQNLAAVFPKPGRIGAIDLAELALDPPMIAPAAVEAVFDRLIDYRDAVAHFILDTGEELDVDDAIFAALLGRRANVLLRAIEADVRALRKFAADHIDRVDLVAATLPFARHAADYPIR